MLYYYVILLKVDWMYSLLRKSPFGNGLWSANETRGVRSKLMMVFTLNFPFVCYLRRIT